MEASSRASPLRHAVAAEHAVAKMYGGHLPDTLDAGDHQGTYDLATGRPVLPVLAVT